MFFQTLPTLQGEEYLVKNYTVEDGMPVNSVSKILQDAEGYLYFATMDGLVRYDGYEFKTYNSANTKGLYSNRISGMILSRHNELWMIHSDGALTRKRGSVFQTFREANGDFPGWAQQIHESHNGTLWVGTTRGVVQFQRESNSFSLRPEALLQPGITEIESRSDGTLFFAGVNGLFQLKNNEVTQLLPSEDSPIPFPGIQQLKIFNQNELWISGTGGAFRYSLRERKITYQFTPNRDIGIWSITDLSENKLALSTSEGFYTFDMRDGKLEKILPEFATTIIRKNMVYRAFGDKIVWLTDNQVLIDGQIIANIDAIQSAFIDREGSLWVSTRYDGVFQIRESGIVNITPEKIPGFENIYPVIQAFDGAVWAGSFHKGIFKLLNNEVTNWNSENSDLEENFIRFLYEDSDNTLFAGVVNQGLWTFSQNRWKKIEDIEKIAGSDLTFQAMHRDQNDRLIMGTTGRALVKENNQYSFFEAESEYGDDGFRGVRVIRENSHGTLFFGTYGHGLTIFKDGVAHTFNSQNSSFVSDFIRDIYVQSVDTIWVASENLGLYRLTIDETGNLLSSINLTVRHGLANNSLHRIIETPDGYLWISSNGGIMRVSKENLNRYADNPENQLNLLVFTEADGMVNREANGGTHTAGFLSDDGKIWFPNQKGITIIDPQKVEVRYSLPNPSPVIESITTSDTILFVDDLLDIEIPASERNLRIKFSAPNFSSPDRIQFRYKLEGIHPDWETGNQGREAVLTNMPPGIHEFQVKVYRPGKEMEATHASIPITIPYFFYETTSFYGLMGIAGLALIFGGIKYRTRILEQREQKLQERVDQQTIALREAAEQKSRFFSGITHELKTPLSLIVSPLEDILEKQDTISDDSTRTRLHLMHRNGQQLKNLVDQILDVTKLNSDAIKLTLKPVNIVELTRQVVGQFQSKLEQEEIELVFESDSIDELIYVDTGAWERILINLLSNAIRFSPRGSTIFLTIKDLCDQIAVSLKDQGIGIDDKDADKIYEYLYQAEGTEAAEGTGIGLYLVKGLVEHMSGTIGLVSKKGEGAKFTVTLKKGYQHFQDTDTVVHEAVDVEISTVNEPTKKARPPLHRNKDSNAGKILVVEDNHDFRNYLATVLTEQYTVITASEGLEAFNILQETGADLVISDVMMPGMNGLEFVSKLRKIDGFKHLPVIFLSAKNQELDVEAGLSSGADIYLTKPIKSKLLLSQVSAVMRREHILRSGQINHSEADETELMRNIREIVYRQLANPALNITMLGDALFMSRTTLYKEWNQITDTSLNDFIKQIRLNEAKVLLTEQKFSVQEAATAVGYSDPNYFSTSFKKQFGVSPSEV